MSESNSVYMCFGIGWELLYIGCSKHAEKRVKQHNYTPWYHRIVYTKIRVYPSRERALAVERRAIRLLRPAYNKQDSRDWINPLQRHNKEGQD